MSGNSVLLDNVSLPDIYQGSRDGSNNNFNENSAGSWGGNNGGGGSAPLYGGNSSYSYGGNNSVGSGKNKSVGFSTGPGSVGSSKKNGSKKQQKRNQLSQSQSSILDMDKEPNMDEIMEKIRKRTGNKQNWDEESIKKLTVQSR